MYNPKSDVVKKGYSKIAEEYHQHRNKYESKVLIKKFLKYTHKGNKVLDLGCGAGVPVSQFLVKKWYKITGIDFVEGMVKLAKKNIYGLLTDRKCLSFSIRFFSDFLLQSPATVRWVKVV